MTVKLPKLTRRVGLMTPVRLPDGAGGFTETWEELGRLWVEILPRSGSAVGAVDLPLGRTGYRITVRAAPPGSPQRPIAGQEFHDGTRRFRIDAVTERDAEGRFLVCFATEDEVST